MPGLKKSGGSRGGVGGGGAPPFANGSNAQEC